MKKFVIALAMLLCLIMAGCGAAVSSSAPSAGVLYEASETSQSLLTASDRTPIVDYGAATNVVIFICFSDENADDVLGTIPANFIDLCNGETDSLRDYYDRLSYGKFDFTSVFPFRDDGRFFIYKDSHPRSYYSGNTSSSGARRTGPESTLLNNAVYEASTHFAFGDRILDVNNDGYVDCVTFLISGAYNTNNWNTIMWPHSWQLDDISKEYRSSSSSSTLSGVNVNNYTFLFIGTFAQRMGLMCHELGHAVGSLPDLYHYQSKYSSYYPVGYWDLMHLDCDRPQFMTAYLRQTYLHFIDDSQVVEMVKSGDYTLKPTVLCDKTDTLAFKLTIDNGTSFPNESIWIEYRRKDVSFYDADLPGSGLLVYRVNTKAYPDGNKNARNQANSSYTSYPDELYVYRPDVSSASLSSDREKENLSYAAVSLDNSVRSSFGKQFSSLKYDPDCIYLTNGKNTGVVITILEESEESITFHIELGDYDGSEIDFNSSYIRGADSINKNEVEIYYGDDILSNLSLYVKRNNRGVYRADKSAITLVEQEGLYEVCEDGKDAYVEYTDEYGTYRFKFLLIIHDVPESTVGTLMHPPTKTEYRAGEEFSLDGLCLQIRYASGVRTVYYTGENKRLWEARGYDTSVCGTYDVTVVYNGEISVHFTVTVVGTIEAIRIDEKNTCHVTCKGMVFHLNVVGVYDGGKEVALDPGKYSIEPDTAYEFMKNEVIVRSTENPDVYCLTYYFLIPERTVTSLSLIADPKRTYRYGEALDLTGGFLQMSFGDFSLDGDYAQPLENYHDVLLTDYSPVTTGKQTLRLYLGDAVLPIEINVLPNPDPLLSSSSDDLVVRESMGYVVANFDARLGDLDERITSYLNVVYTLTLGEETFRVSPETYADLPVKTDLHLLLYNDDQTLIKEYVVCRLGDGNDDGVLTTADILYWKRSIVLGEEIKKGVLFDKNGDMRYTLTDFILLLDELEATE